MNDPDNKNNSYNDNEFEKTEELEKTKSNKKSLDKSDKNTNDNSRTNNSNFRSDFIREDNSKFSVEEEDKKKKKEEAKVIKEENDDNYKFDDSITKPTVLTKDQIEVKVIQYKQANENKIYDAISKQGIEEKKLQEEINQKEDGDLKANLEHQLRELKEKNAISLAKTKR